MQSRGRERLNSQIYGQATEWFIDCRAGDLDDSSRRAFDAWLRKSPEHLAAYLEIAAIWDQGASLDAHRKNWDTETLIAQAAQERDNVVTLASTPRSLRESMVARESPPTTRSAPAHHRARALAWRRIVPVAASLIVLAALGTYALLRPPTYETATGEQRSIELEDGSTMQLNSRSKVAVHFEEHERGIELLEGQALFHVAKDPSRPFVVRSGGTRVRAVGTEFDVYKKSTGTVVTVVEGRVAIVPGVSSGTASPNTLAAIPLSAGEQLTVTAHAVARAPHANLASATAWTQRQIVFDAASLHDVAEEFNRYNRKQLVVEDSELESFHISGVFSSTDPASLVRFLRERPGLTIIESASEVRIVKNNSRTGG